MSLLDLGPTASARALIASELRRMSRLGGFRTAEPVVVETPDLHGGGSGSIPFPRATTEKTSMLTPESFTLAATRTPFKRVVDGNGYMYGIVLDLIAVTAANALAVTFTEDAPWNAYDTVVLSDVAGELINVGGFDLFLANLAMKQYAVRSAADMSRLFSLNPGAGATGGTFRFGLRVPVGLNRRGYPTVLGNQDRFTKFDLRTDISASATIYATAPTTLPPVTIDKYYEFLTIPAAKTQGPNPVDQEQYPADYGRLHFITAGDSEAAPAPSTTRPFFLRRIGNTIRYIIVVFRAGVGTTPRALAEANLPTNITFKIGDDTIFSEQVRYRQWAMFERYGFDFPAGVLLYDVVHDFSVGAGNEIGDQYWYTQGLNNAFFQFTFPAGFTTGGSLHFITDDLQEGAFGRPS